MQQECTMKLFMYSARYSPPTVETDFIGDVITVTLPQPGGGSGREVEVEIPIIDDRTVEVDELFLGYIDIVNAVDNGTIVLGRNTIRLGIIEFSDSKEDLKLTYYKNKTYPHSGYVLCQDLVSALLLTAYIVMVLGRDLLQE